MWNVGVFEAARFLHEQALVEPEGRGFFHGGSYRHPRLGNHHLGPFLPLSAPLLAPGLQRVATKGMFVFFPEGPAVRRPTNAPLDLAVLLVFALQCSGGGALPPNIRQGII